MRWLCVLLALCVIASTPIALQRLARGQAAYLKIDNGSYKPATLYTVCSDGGFKLGHVAPHSKAIMYIPFESLCPGVRMAAILTPQQSDRDHFITPPLSFGPNDTIEVAIPKDAMPGQSAQ